MGFSNYYHYVRDFYRAMNIASIRAMAYNHFGMLIIFLAVKYQMPLMG